MSNIFDKWISNDYQSRYNFVLKVVLASVVLGTVIAKVFKFAAASSDWGAAMQTAAVQLLGAVAIAFIFVTALFAFFSYSGMDVKMTVPYKAASREFSKTGVISRIFFSMIFSLIFLISPQIFGITFDDVGFISVLNVSTLKAVWYVFAGITLLEISKEVVRLIAGVHTKWYVAVSVVLNILLLALSGAWLLNGDIINQALITNITSQLGDADFFRLVLENCNVVLFVIVAFGLVVEMVNSARKLNNK